jgi:hypothetical protein
MPHEYNDSAKVHLNRDNSGLIRDLLHIDQPFVSNAPTAQLAAAEYLAKFGNMLGISDEQLRKLALHPEEQPVDADVEYRFAEEKTQFDSTTVVFQQTYAGLPVWEAAVAVQLL